MRKNFTTYSLIWAILFAVFNVICFVTPNEAFGMSKFGGAFWVGYIFITIAFLGNLACAYLAFKAENLKKLFYNLPLITISYTGLILMLVFGVLSMVMPNILYWVGIIICFIVLAFNAIAVIKASWAVDIVSAVDEKVKTQTQFIKLLTVDAQGFVDRAKSDAVKGECKKVFDAVRYSDPMSNDALSVIEAEITVKMDEFGNTVSADDAEQAKNIAAGIVLLVNERNNKCSNMK